MRLRVVAFLVSCLLLPGAAAQDAPLQPREPRVVDVAPDAPASLALVLHNGTPQGELLVVVGDSLISGDEADVSVDVSGEATRPARWTRGADPEGLEPHPVLVREDRATLNATVSARGAARLLFYHDVSCNCSNKTALFPGALLAFHVDAVEGGTVRGVVQGPAGSTIRVDSLGGGASGPGLATATSAAGKVNMEWTATDTGRGYLLVTVVEGVGLVEVALTHVPPPPSETPWPWGVSVVAVGVAAALLGRRGARSR